MHYETVTVGMEVPVLTRGPINTGHIMRWSAAIENWHPLHYDRRHAVDVDGLPDVLINGSWKQQILLQMLSEWLAGEGWLFRFGLRYRRMNIPGDTITAWGKITDRAVRNGFGVVDLSIGLRDQNGVENTEGEATVVLPLRDGPAVPYPFDPKLIG